MTLIERLQEFNAEARAWMAAGPDRWAGLVSEDPAWWLDAYGVTTAEGFDDHLDAMCEAATTDADRRYFEECGA